jgi:hypothetical protein
LTAADLNAALSRKTHRLRSLIRRGSDRELLTALTWAEDFELREVFPPIDGVAARPRRAGVEGGVFYVWRPDFEKYFPDAAAAGQGPEKPKQRGRPPKHNWPELAGRVARKVQDFPARTNAWIAKEIRRDCRARGENPPPISDLNGYISAMKQHLGPR